MKNATRTNNVIARNAAPTVERRKHRRLWIDQGKPSFEPLEGRRMMSQVSLVDGMLILQGNAHGNNRLTVSPDPGGQTLFARANDVKAHYLLKDVKTIRVAGGEKADNVVIDTAIKQGSYIKVGDGRDSVIGGGGSDTIIGGHNPDTLIGGSGDDLILGGGQGADKINAGSGDDPTSITPHKSTENPVSVASLTLVDATTNRALFELKDGATLNLAGLPQKLNVRANLSVGSYDGSVRFAYDGVTLSAAENIAPYALSGDTNGDFKTWEPKVGQHTLKATPYAGKNASGAAGTEMLVTFNVIDNPDAPTPQEIDDTGGNTGTGDNDQPPPTNINQADAPTAVITAIDASVPEGMAIHVNGISSTLKAGDPLSARYEWDFGDAGSKYNKLVGFNAAHAYAKAGTYTVTLKVTNSSGASDTVSKTITVTAAGRRFVYVSPGGNDANNGSSQSAAVKTFKRAAALVGDNAEVLFERGATYATADTMSLGHSNVVVGAYGTGAAPVIQYTGGKDYGTLFTTMGGKDVLIKNLTFDSSNTNVGDQGFNDGVRIGGQNITVRDCTVVNVGSFVNTNGHPDGVLVQDNAVTKKAGLRAYFAWVQGADQVYLGNSVPDSVNLHVIRVGGADRVLIAHNDLTNLSSTAERPTISMHKGSYVYTADNKLTDSCVEVGPLNQGGGLKEMSARIKWVVVENNAINNASLELLHGIEHLSVRNNVISNDGGTAINLVGYSQTYQRGSSDVYIVHNTVINNAKTGRFLKVGGAVDGVTLTNNLYVAPHYETGAYGAAPVYVAGTDLSSFRVIGDNVWPMPTMLASAGGGINMVGDYVTATKWESYAEVKHDQFQDVTLSTSYKVSLGGITAGADMDK